jgi:hypothetical protein
MNIFIHQIVDESTTAPLVAGHHLRFIGACPSVQKYQRNERYKSALGEAREV